MSSSIRSFPRLFLIGLLGLSLSACATDRQRTRAEGTAAGAAAGAALGRAIAGNDRGTVVGALLGGIVGAVVGNRVANKKAAYAQREEELRLSAQRAAALVESTREQNEQIEREVAELGAAVAQLQSAKDSAEARRLTQTENQQKLSALVESVERQLEQMKEEMQRQDALIAATEAQDVKDRRDAEQEPSEGLQLVAAGLRDLEQQTRRLELARLQLQQIDERRAY
ncbi:glycine zipper domain-containing protein [Tahibacter caeni]|uniref:glycine zipper domain-containing protein n=1 Tax=Tahibacter caeni TaxID=1453545 RepID=UPI0021471DB3|nr:glycine zipper domain-containing protein [Tahibacter caeni]